MFLALAWATVGTAPAVIAAYSGPGRWSILAAVGAATATTGLLVSNLRCARRLASLESSERQLQSAASAAEIRIAALVAEVHDASTHDAVTGTLNRSTLLARLGEVAQHDARLQRPLAFLLIDVDGFKQVNSEAGRMIGDRVLLAVARAIQASTRGTDFIGRIGGDEFAVVLGECVDPSPAIDRILAALHGETTGGDAPLPIGVSIGAVTIPEPQTGVDPCQLILLAEEALASARDGAVRCRQREYRVETRSPVSSR